MIYVNNFGHPRKIHPVLVMMMKMRLRINVEAKLVKYSAAQIWLVDQVERIKFGKITNLLIKLKFLQNK